MRTRLQAGVTLGDRRTRTLLAATWLSVVGLLLAYLLVSWRQEAVTTEHAFLLLALGTAGASLLLLRQREAEMAGTRLELDERHRREQSVLHHRMQLRQQVAALLAVESGMQIHLQPIVTILERRVVGYEGLARFESGSPRHWFEQAEQVGLGRELDLAALTRALDRVDDIDGYLSVNVSPATLLDDRLEAVFASVDASNVVIELTEHVAVDDYELYRPVIERLRALGARIAVDDAGAGHSSMRHIVRLAPEFVKLDRSLVDHVDDDPVRRAMVAAMASFSESIGTTLIAEGVERPEEASALFDIGVPLAQGYLFGRPAPTVIHLD